MPQSIDDYKNAANSLFTITLALWKASDNVWRNGCAMDTILDYLSVCEVDNPAQYGETAIETLDPTKKGNWWDDFGWIGIAALRAAELNLFPNYTDQFVKIAINCWTYMYGPGWSSSNTAVYPFTDDDLPGWKTFADSHKTNRGAPNVWDDIDQTWTKNPPTEDQKMERRPRYSPGGIWNAPITDSSAPDPKTDYLGEESYVAPIQNTVTNAVFTILSLRIHQAGASGRFDNVFGKSEMNGGACLQAWKHQIRWFELWLIKTADADQSMKISDDTGTLIRERATTFYPWKSQMYWDASYTKEWFWTGDQGLLVGALRETKASGYGQTEVLTLYPEIIDGVFNNGYRARTYASKSQKPIEGSFLMPWFKIGAKDPYNARALASDKEDYQTGTGVFMRYLLQAYQAEPGLAVKYKDVILNSADNIIKLGFGTDPSPEGDCDAYTEYLGADKATRMSPYINRLAVLLLAIEMSR
jgi:hypothetical protein